MVTLFAPPPYFIGQKVIFTGAKYPIVYTVKTIVGDLVDPTAFTFEEVEGEFLMSDGKLVFRGPLIDAANNSR